MEKLSIHRALEELKLLDKRINKSMETNFINVKKSVDIKVGGVLVTDLENDIKSSFESVTALIKRRDTIKSAITQSNAVTIVKIGEEEMTVAIAIDKKTSISYKVNLLNKLTSQYSNAVNKVEQHNIKVDTQSETYVNGLYSDKNSVDSNKIKDLKQDYIDNNKYELINPINIKKHIDRLNTEIYEFQANVNSTLSESNAVTFIEI